LRHFSIGRRKLRRLRLAVLHRTDGSSSGGSKRSSAGSKTQEFLMLLCHLAASTSSGAVDSVIQSSALTCFATASQSSTLRPPFAPSGIHL
jgi:hypothetical protein